MMRHTKLLMAFLLATACSADRGDAASDEWVSLFNGMDLNGWIVPEGDNGHWKVIDGVIDYDALSEAPGDKNLWSERSFGDFVLRIDWRLTDYAGMWAMAHVLPDGSHMLDEDGNEIRTVRPNADSGIYLRGTAKAQVNLWAWPIGSGEVWGYRTDPAMPPEVRSAVTPLVRADNPVGEWNSMEITMLGDRLTVILNEQLVIDNAQLPDVPEEGPIALQHHGGLEPDGTLRGNSSLVQFRNIYIRELSRAGEVSSDQ